jgi:hypothetical protein
VRDSQASNRDDDSRLNDEYKVLALFAASFLEICRHLIFSSLKVNLNVITNTA